jgi:hypothetical protein
MNANGFMTAAALTFPLFKTSVDFWILFVGKNQNGHLGHIQLELQLFHKYLIYFALM